MVPHLVGSGDSGAMALFGTVNMHSSQVCDDCSANYGCLRRLAALQRCEYKLLNLRNTDVKSFKKILYICLHRTHTDS